MCPVAALPLLPGGPGAGIPEPGGAKGQSQASVPGRGPTGQGDPPAAVFLSRVQDLIHLLLPVPPPSAPPAAEPAPPPAAEPAPPAASVPGRAQTRSSWPRYGMALLHQGMFSLGLNNRLGVFGSHTTIG